MPGNDAAFCRNIKSHSGGCAKRRFCMLSIVTTCFGDRCPGISESTTIGRRGSCAGSPSCTGVRLCSLFSSSSILKEMRARRRTNIKRNQLIRSIPGRNNRENKNTINTVSLRVPPRPLISMLMPSRRVLVEMRRRVTRYIKSTLRWGGRGDSASFLLQFSIISPGHGPLLRAISFMKCCNIKYGCNAHV